MDTQNCNVVMINKWISEYGKIIATFEAGPTVYIADPELVRQIQIKDFQPLPAEKNFNGRRRIRCQSQI